MKIKSITDVITNSSTEVFCYKLDDPEYKEIQKAIPWLTWQEFKTEEDIKNFVMDSDYYGIPWDSYSVQKDHGPENATPSFDIMNVWEFKENIKDKKTPEEIWEFIKDFYVEALLGKSVAYFCNEGMSSNMYKNVTDFLDLKYKEKLEKHLSQFKVGDILEVDLVYSLNNGTKTVLIKKVSDTSYEPIKEAWESAGVFKVYDPKVLDKDWVYLIKPITTRKYEN